MLRAWALAAVLACGCATVRGASVRSMAEERHDRVVMQKWDNSCGAAALATLLTYDHGDPHSEQMVAEELLRLTDEKTVRAQQGFSLFDLQRYAELHGYAADGYGELTLADLRDLAPAIVPVHFSGYDHFVVVRGVEEGTVYFADPAYGRRAMPVSAFEDSWPLKIAFVAEANVVGNDAFPASEAEGAQQEEEPSPERDVSTRALERALSRQSGLVIPKWSADVSPELGYVAWDRGGMRNDVVSSAISAQLGLPWTMQVYTRVPWVLIDTTPGEDPISGPGDAELGLTKLLVAEDGAMPAVLATAAWKSTTGRLLATPTGTGFHSFQGEVNVVKRDDPLVISGSGYGAWNVERNGVDPGDAIGGSARVYLAATPDSSLSAGLDVTWFDVSTMDGVPLSDADSLSGVVRLGMYTNIVPKLLMSLDVGVGITPDAPDVSVSVAVPWRL